MEKIVVLPRIVDDIEFYITDSGIESGMSEAGLARLSGVSAQTLNQRLLANLALTEEENATWNCPKCLEDYRGNVFYLQLIGGKGGIGAKIVREEVCAGVIEYYSFDSRHNNEIARKNYRKFARKGINQWIKEITGFSEENKTDQLLSMMQELISEVKELRVVTHQHNNICRTTVHVFPRLDEMLDDLAKDDAKALLSAENFKPVVLVDWLKEKGVTLDKSHMHRFANLVAETYRTMTGKDPVTVLGENKKGYLTIKRNGYRVYEFPVLEIALKKLFL